MNVADRWKQVVFLVKVQATEKPTQNRVASIIIHGHVCLVNCPGPFNLPGVLPGDREFRLFHTVWQLKHNTQGAAKNQDPNDIVKYNDMQRVKEQWYHKGPCKKGGLTRNEDY